MTETTLLSDHTQGGCGRNGPMRSLGTYSEGGGVGGKSKGWNPSAALRQLSECEELISVFLGLSLICEIQ